MKSVKKLTALLIVISIFVGLLSGCTATAEGKALFDAMVKSQGIRSSMNDIEMSLKLDSAGLSEKDSAGFAQASAMLKDVKWSMNMKQITNEELTASKSEVGMKMSMGGISMDMGAWVEMDLTGSEPVLKEIIKVPSMVFAAYPSLAGKEYLVMDLNDMMKTSGTGTSGEVADISGFMKVSKELKEKADVFLSSYLAQYDPGFKLITDAGMREITTPEGKVNAHIYKISLDDKSAKQLVRYTVNNLADNKDAMAFVIEYVKLVQQVSVSANPQAGQSVEFDKMLADFETKKPELLTKFNGFMDGIENTRLIGDKGIVLEYAIDEKGFIVSQSANMDIVMDMSMLSGMTGAENAAPGTISAAIGFNMLTYNINKDMNIEMPSLTAENSMDFNKYMEAVMQSALEAQGLTAAPSDVVILLDGKPVSINAYNINGSNYVGLRGLAAALKGSPKQFDVSWDKEGNAINLTSNKAYTVVGGEIVSGVGSGKIAVMNTSAIMKDGVRIYLHSYKIDGSNYVRLRDIAQAFDLGITWDASTKTINLDTASGHTEQ